MESQNKSVRFSDEKLEQLHQEFKAHIHECKESKEQYKKQFEVLISAQQKNTDEISILIKETRGIIQLHQDIQGAARIGKSLQEFGLRLAKWGTVGIALGTAWNLWLDHLKEIVK